VVSWKDTEGDKWPKGLSKIWECGFLGADELKAETEGRSRVAELVCTITHILNHTFQQVD